MLAPDEKNDVPAVVPAVEETVAVAPAAANNNEPKPPVPATISKKRKVLAAIFNMAVGAGLAAVAKTAVVSAMIGCPPLAIVLATSFAVGAVMTGMCHEGKRRAAKKAGAAAPDFFSKQNARSFFNRQNAKVFAKSTLFSFIGGALFLGFHEGVIQDAFHKLFGSHAAAAAAPPVIAVPVDVPPPCPTPAEDFANLIKDHHVSARVQDALHRAASTNAHVAAQGTKDLAFFSFNGFDGVPKNPHVALELLQKAADAGNHQAQVDLLYTQYHGLAGVHANPQAAFNVMQDVHNPRATWFVERWASHFGKHAAHQAFDSKSILQGIKFCPSV